MGVVVGWVEPGAGLDGQAERVALDHPGREHRLGQPGLGRGQQPGGHDAFLPISQSW